MKQINQKQMIEKVTKNVEGYEKELSTAQKNKGRNSFSAWGAKTRLGAAQSLLNRLNRGGIPSTREVVGYFGKGARFQEEK